MFLRSRPLWLALLCSCTVYLIPIFGPHAVFLLGEMLWQQFRTFKDPAWAFSALGIALLLQAETLALFFWFWSRRGVLPALALAASAVSDVIIVQLVYMVMLPSYFMIQAERSKE